MPQHAAAIALRSAGIALALLGGSGPLTAAQPVYRCGPNLYAQQPCEGGRAVDAADPRSAEQLAQARKSSADQARLTRQMQDERLAAERKWRPQGPAGIGPASRSPEAASGGSTSKATLGDPRKRSATGAKPKPPKEFVAFVPESGSSGKAPQRGNRSGRQD